VGAVQEGPVVVSLGTSGTGFAYRTAPAVDPQGEAAAFCDSTGGWLPLVCTLNCTVATDWARHLLGLDPEAFERALVESEPGAGGLAFLPHLGGERTPNCPAGAGAFAGLRPTHGPAEIIRAVAEGVTFGLRYALGALERAGVRATQITLVGGGAASDAWAQLCADVFELPVRRSAAPEAAARGAARQARWVVDGTAATEDEEDAGRWEPARHPGLVEAAARAYELRRLAIQGVL
ncbi:MAG: FGGY-family carbohydrate kinase, partial [Chloroflexota bacterium]|nr:FGGY-family carbohydrate kinase [Chloroflexota bacterium]